ncbi:MAG: hypothetical protein KGI67_02700 [Pseudomonadota bacterium]|nr:hypothetical protein [Pseudomonadota bacterium]
MTVSPSDGSHASLAQAPDSHLTGAAMSAEGHAVSTEHAVVLDPGNHDAGASDLFHFGDIGTAHDSSTHLAASSWTDAIDAEHGLGSHVAAGAGDWTSDIEGHPGTAPGAHHGDTGLHDDHGAPAPDLSHLHQDHSGKTDW